MPLQHSRGASQSPRSRSGHVGARERGQRLCQRCTPTPAGSPGLRRSSLSILSAPHNHRHRHQRLLYICPRLGVLLVSPSATALALLRTLNLRLLRISPRLSAPLKSSFALYQISSRCAPELLFSQDIESLCALHCKLHVSAYRICQRVCDCSGQSLNAGMFVAFTC